MRNKKLSHLSTSVWLVRFVGLIVPCSLRADWRQEWEAELSYREAMLADWDKLNWKTKLDLLRRSLSSFWDALLLQPRRLEDEMFQDLRFGARMLVKSKAFTIVAVLSLALGIGANTAIFSLIDAVLLKRLPVAQPEQLFFITNIGTRGAGGAPPYPCFERFRDHTRHLSGIIALSPTDSKLGIDGQIEQVKGQFVSGNYFALLGVRALVGRVFSLSDDSIAGQGGPDGAVAVIGYNYWKRRFALDPAVVGKEIQVDKRPVTIVGVTPPEFHGLAPGRDDEIYLPIMLAGSELSDRGAWWLDVVGRLKAGASIEQARAELDAIFQSFMDEGSATREQRKEFFDHIELTAASHGLDMLRRQYSKPLQVLMGVVVLVLLVACVNVANLLLARATARRREFAVRMAMGASRLRLARQMLTESLLLVGLGGLFGLLLARWGSALLVNFFATGRRQLYLDLQLDGRVMLFTLGLSLLTGVVFAVAPAWRATRLDPGTALKENAATASGDRSRLRLGKLLVVVQVSLSLLLLVGAGLFLRSLQNLRNLDAGFRTEGVLTMQIDPGAREYQRPQLDAFWQELLARVKATPGVQQASLSVLSPLDGRNRGVLVEAPGFTPGSEHDRIISLNHVSPEYFATMGIAVLRGRPFNERDHESAPRIALLNETAARFYFGDRNPIGAQIRFHVPRNAAPVEVVGVVRDSRHTTLREEIPRLLYLPTLQPINRMGRLTLSVRTGGEPNSLAALAIPIKNEIREMGPDILVTNVITLDEQVNQTLLQERLVSSLSSVFGLLALLLACIGLYGVMSYDTARRTHEIGIRVALGARAGDIMRLVMRETVLLVVIGVALGLGAALATTRLISNLLFGLAPNDPLTVTLAVLLLVGVAALAGYLPARRAARVDPMAALRSE
jgi:predicted permease